MYMYKPILEENATYRITVVEWVTKFLQGIKELDIVFSFIGIVSYPAVNVSPCLLKRKIIYGIKKKLSK